MLGKTMDIDIDKINALMEALRRYDFHEIDIELGDTHLSLRRHTTVPVNAAPPTNVTHAMSEYPASSMPSTPPASSAVNDDANYIFVTSPFVGTFYLSPSPSSDPFVRVGDRVKPGQPLCIVEAMKLMNEIESDAAGTIVEVMVSNGKPVEFGDRLFKLSP